MGLSGYANTPELDLLKLDSTKLNVLIQRYLLENLHFTTNKEILPIHYLGSQKEDNGIWCFLEYENLNPFDEISVFNSLLVNTFSYLTIASGYSWAAGLLPQFLLLLLILLILPHLLQLLPLIYLHQPLLSLFFLFLLFHAFPCLLKLI